MARARKKELIRDAKEIGLALNHIGNVHEQEIVDREERLQGCVTMLEIIQKEIRDEAEGAIE